MPPPTAVQQASVMTPIPSRSRRLASSAPEAANAITPDTDIPHRASISRSHTTIRKSKGNNP